MDAASLGLQSERGATLMEFISDPALMAKIAIVILIVNAILSGAKVALEKIAPTTESKLDDGALTVIGFLQKILDFFSGNVEHKK